MGIPMDRWGRDHWSVFAYIETCAVDHGGELDRRRMRCDPQLHHQFAHEGSADIVPPTHLRFEAVQEHHDDWSCADDVEEAGLIQNIGTGLHRVYRLTMRGDVMAAVLRRFKAEGGTFATFGVPPSGDATEG